MYDPYDEQIEFELERKNRERRNEENAMKPLAVTTPAQWEEFWQGIDAITGGES